MDESHKYFVQNKPDKKEQELLESIYTSQKLGETRSLASATFT
jgi:hypothetical protein